MAMQSASSRQKDAEIVAAPPDEGDAIANLATVLRVMLFLGLALILLGAVIGLARDGRLPTETVGVHRLPGQVMMLHADGVLTLGILTFLCSPAVVLIYLCVSFLRVHERVFAGVCALVFAIIMASFVIAQFS